MTTHTTFKATIYLLTANEGGRKDPLFDGYRTKFRFPSGSVTGGITLPEDRPMAEPGDTLDVTAKLIEPVAMEPGLRFEVYEPGHEEEQDGQWVQVSDDKTVIRGEVTEILR